MEINISNEPDKNWDFRVKTLQEGTWHQSSLIGKYYKMVGRGKPYYIKSISKDGKILGQMVLLETGYIELDSAKGIKKLGGAMLSKVFPKYYCIHGPLVFSDYEQENIISDMITESINFTKDKNAFSISYTPPFHVDSPKISLKEYSVIFRENGFSLLPKATVIRHTDKESLVKYPVNGETKRKIKKGISNGIIIEQVDNNETLVFFKNIIRENGVRLGLENSLNWKRYQPHWELIKTDKASIFWVARDEESYLCAQMAYFFNGIVFLGGVSISDRCRMGVLNANDVMQWHVINWAIDNCYKIVDWVGLSSGYLQGNKNGIDRFKLKWGYPFELFEAVAYFKPRGSSLIEKLKGIKQHDHR